MWQCVCVCVAMLSTCLWISQRESEVNEEETLFTDSVSVHWREQTV